ncbi:MAG: hypothetical protein FRX49_07735 [Trebouxia sp. A1-2]|nr:MAG: hypothetical protein FRX49_07735 [Trebouxia sp. A1-2]
MLVAFSRRICQSRLLSLRSLVTQTTRSAPAEEPSTSTSNAAVPQSAGPLQEARKAAWWSDPKVDAVYAYNIIKSRFKNHGPQRKSVFPTFQTVNESLTCLSTKSYDVALEALQRVHELGLQFDNNFAAYYKVMKAAITNGRLDIATSVFEAMKDNGVRPGGKVVHVLIMGSIVNGRRDLAEAYAEEFRCNNVKINSASQQWLDGTRQPDNISNLEAEVSEGFQDSTTNEAPAEQQQAATAVASA